MKNKSLIKKEVTVNGLTIKVIKKNASTCQMIKEGIISERDAEMDKRARNAVSIAKRQAKICNKPIAVYDINSNEAYLVNAFGERVNFG